MADDGSHVHHHSALAGVGAGTAAVLFAFGVLALAWHRVAGQVSMAVAVLAYAVMAAVAVIVGAGAFYVLLWVRHRARHPEILAGRQVIQAEVLDDAPVPQAVHAAASPAAAIEPPREVHLHFHTADPAEAAAIIRTALPGSAGDDSTEGEP
jgi:hypothetical protein